MFLLFRLSDLYDATATEMIYLSKSFSAQICLDSVYLLEFVLF